MERIKGRPSGTHVDVHGDRMTLEALHDMAKQINEHYIPMTVEHDPRLPPIGRIVSATVVPLDDGEFALETESEIWDEKDTLLTLKGDGRTVSIRSVDDSLLFNVVFDRSYLTKEGQSFVVDLAQLASPEAKPSLEIKKSVDPISVLIIASAVVATGFFQRLGTDIYEEVKAKLKEWREKAPTSHEAIFDFILVSEKNGQQLEVHLLVSSPTPDDLDALFERGFDYLGPDIDSILSKEPRVSKVVLVWKSGKVQIDYILRNDGIPVTFDEGLR